MEIKNIEQEFKNLKSASPRKAAELAYVIAMIAKKNGDNEKAIKYGRESIDIFNKLNVQSYEDCASQYVTVNNISLPELIHADVVKNRLLPIKL